MYTQTMSNPLNPTLRVIGYIRVSTDKQDISPAVQRAELEREAERMGYEPTIIEELAASASTIAKRPLIQEALTDLKAHKYDGLMVSKLDRLSRNTEDGTKLLADSTRQGWRIICLDLGVDTSSIMGAGLFNMALTFAEIERKLISKRTSDAMQDEARKGKHMGRRSTLPESTRKRVHQLKGEGLSLRKIADTLTNEGLTTASGGKWHASTVKQILGSVTSNPVRA